MQGQNLWEGYFPILIQLYDDGRRMVCNTPQDIPAGKDFNILKCNVEPEPINYQI